MLTVRPTSKVWSITFVVFRTGPGELAPLNHQARGLDDSRFLRDPGSFQFGKKKTGFPLRKPGQKNAKMHRMVVPDYELNPYEQATVTMDVLVQRRPKQLLKTSAVPETLDHLPYLG